MTVITIYSCSAVMSRMAAFRSASIAFVVAWAINIVIAVVTLFVLVT
ncbi:MAG: hypothetical protein ACR2Q4_06215 [Geminicoccaceae bacterium]